MDALGDRGCFMTFSMTIQCDNAAFEDAVGVEVARILEAAAKALRQGYEKGRCMDSNGNRVGNWELTEGGDQ